MMCPFDSHSNLLSYCKVNNNFFNFSDDVQGLGICEFSTLSSKICTQPDKIFHLFFVLFNKSEREFSCPIGIQNPFNRKSICIRVFDNKYVSNYNKNLVN